MIEADIVDQLGAGEVSTEVQVPGGRIDVLIRPNQVYEIKPFGGTVDPERQISGYIVAAGELLGVPLVRGTIEFDRLIDGPLGLTELHYSTTSPGVIEYTAFPSVKLLTFAIAFVGAYNTAQLTAQTLFATSVETLAPGVP